MAGVKLTVAVVALALSGVVATAAHADPLAFDPSKVPAGANQWAPQAQHKTFEWDAAKSRWGLKFDFDQQSGSPTEWKNVQAGVTYKLSPSLHVGAGVALGDTQTLNPTGSALTQTPAPPRVHFETGFKF